MNTNENNTENNFDNNVYLQVLLNDDVDEDGNYSINSIVSDDGTDYINDNEINPYLTEQKLIHNKTVYVFLAALDDDGVYAVKSIPEPCSDGTCKISFSDEKISDVELQHIISLFKK